MDEKNQALQPYNSDNFKITIDYLSGKIFNDVIPANKTIQGTILESRKKNIVSDFWVINLTGKDIQLTEFDRAVFNICISEQAEGKKFTTAKTIFHKLGGGRDLTPTMKRAIMESVEKLAGVRVIIDSTNAIEKRIVKDGGKVKNKDGKFIFKGYLLPTESVELTLNGQEVEVIGFLKSDVTDKIKKGVIYTNAENHDQIISCTQDLLQAPVNSNPRNIALNHYLLRRSLSIKGSNELAEKNKHVKPLCKVILIDDMMEHCGLAEYDKYQQNKILKTTKKILDFLIERNVISNYQFETVKNTGKIRSIILEFQLLSEKNN